VHELVVSVMRLTVERFYPASLRVVSTACTALGMSVLEKLMQPWICSTGSIV
jgi:hypothetical protein